MLSNGLLEFDSSAKMASSLLTLWLRAKGPNYLTEGNRMIDAVTLRDRLIVTIVGEPKS
jgi:hypothetical protein